MTEPVVILVHPQIGENIGATARAMLNCGLTRLRLVRPREAWPNPKAQAAAAGADIVLDGAEIFETTAAAVADINRLYATTARPRDMVKPVLRPRAAASAMRDAIADGERVGILFGAERSGLDNDDITRADGIIEIPTNPEFSSFNLAQAVLICAYEWQGAGPGTETSTGRRGTLPAAKKDLDDMFAHLMEELDHAGFLRPPEKRPGMVRNIRNIFERASLTDQEVRTLRGIISALVKFR